MSDYLKNDEYKYLYAIIRKPQEGKTFICLENIRQNNSTIHLVITMNTIKSNSQFFERAYQKFSDNILVLNSKKNSLSYQVNEIYSAWSQIKENTKEVLIMCAHKKRFTESIFQLLTLLKSTVSMTKKVIIHIDEAHAYIPSFRNQVIKMNEHSLVEQIYCYSATPFNVWKDDSHLVFKKIYVVDVEEQFKIMASDEYFGVKDVELVNISPFEDTKFEEMVSYQRDIPLDLLEKFEPQLIEKCKTTWYSKERTYFALGYEYEYLCFIKYMLNYLECNGFLKHDCFSYNFIPGYIRRISHYGVMDLIMKQFPDALVVVFNGIVCQGFIKQGGKYEEVGLLESNEPSLQLEDLVQRLPGRPTFITGHICIGMSVTLINPTLGNFDNAVMHFPQYYSQPDVLYQMCRFLFNYISWKPEQKSLIKKTRFITADTMNYQICREYEKQIDLINMEMKGSLRTQDEVSGKIKVKKSIKPKVLQNAAIEKEVILHDYKKFKVYDGNDEEIMEKVYQEWLQFRGHKIPSNSKLKKNEHYFYQCSTTKKNMVHDLHSMNTYLKNLKWDSNIQLAKNNYRYSRLYVAYDDIEDPSEYTIFMKKVELNKNEVVKKYLDKLKK